LISDYTHGTREDGLIMFGGFRTTWGLLREPGDACDPTTTTTTLQPLTTTTTLAPDPFGLRTDVVLTDSEAPVDMFETLTDMPTTTTVFVAPTEPSFQAVTQYQTSWTTTTSTTTTTTTLFVPTTTSTTMSVDMSEYVVSGRPPMGPPVDLSSSNTESTLPVGPSPDCVPKYYFDDVWLFDTGGRQWIERHTTKDRPAARRGQAMIVRRTDSDDTQMVIFGGHSHDTVFADIWTLDVMRDRDERIWTQVDNYMPEPKPSHRTYHTMLLDEETNEVIIFGGISWNTTNMNISDRLRNIDRRCLKEAQGMPQAYDGWLETTFLQKMSDFCRDTEFCCPLTKEMPPPVEVYEQRIRTTDSLELLNLTAISYMCRRNCEDKAFIPAFSAVMMEGIWILKTDLCPHNCSGHGRCEFTQCICEPDWYGTDCSQRRCPGSMCYAHPRSKEQFCVECSQHGRCIDGVCQCFPGWTYDDCSTPGCESNCSSTPSDTHGVCVEDFPVHQCQCLGRWTGPKCSQQLCLNECTGRGTCTNGTCVCDAGFYGTDCSVFAFPLEDSS